MEVAIETTNTVFFVILQRRCLERSLEQSFGSLLVSVTLFNDAVNGSSQATSVKREETLYETRTSSALRIMSLR